jgi:GDPmannose 4,6-dehydratase
MWMMLQKDKPSDYVLATGETHTVREFVEKSFAHIGRPIEWSGKGLEETGVCAKTGATLVSIEPRYFRPTEVDYLHGDPAKAHRELGWKHTTKFSDLVAEMIDADRQLLSHNQRTQDGWPDLRTGWQTRMGGGAPRHGGLSAGAAAPQRDV